MASRIVSVVVLALAAILAGCSKSDAPAPQTKAAAPIQAAPSADPSKPAEIDPALRERLARQEAAAQLFERKVVEPPAPKVAESKKAPEPAKPEPPKPEPVKAAPPPAAEPPKVAAAAPAKASAPPPATASAPASAPAKSEPPPRTDVAAAKPSAAPATAAARLITRVDPDFPREAAQSGVDKGTVKARMLLDETGAVTRVEIVEATPRRVFDRAVIRALSQWKFSEGAAGRSVEMEIEFKR
jgi:protein TonB